MRTTPALLLVAALLAAPAVASAHPHDAPPPPPPPPPGSTPPPPPGREWSGRDAWAGRDSWYIGFGIGSGGGAYTVDGTRVNFRRHHDAVTGGLGLDPFHVSFQLEAGATLTPRLLLGGELSALVSQADDLGVESTLTVSQLLAVVTYFPMERGLFFRGGAGLATIESELDDGFFRTTDRATGVGMVGGVGYAWWLGRRFNLTLHADLFAHRYGGSGDRPDHAEGVNAYLGFRWY
jgi:hypothetical protein